MYRCIVLKSITKRYNQTSSKTFKGSNRQSNEVNSFFFKKMYNVAVFGEYI